MESEQKLIARKLFKLRVYEAKGTAYQQLLEKVLGYADDTFVPVRTWGKLGDGGNDGYSPATGVYYQVYAPSSPETKVTEAAAKAAADFDKLVANWQETTPLAEYRFAYNDEYNGSPQPVEEALATIRKQHNVRASVFLAKDLENVALGLADDEVFEIVDTTIPTPGLLDMVDFGALREVIVHILSNKEPLSASSSLVAPDFEEKIHFNGLTRAVASFLTVGSYQYEAVRDYFSKNSTFARQHLRDHLAALYADKKAKVTALGVSSSEQGDLVFFDLLDEVTPNFVDKEVASRAQEAAIVLLSYYFEACDIFEDPNAAT